MEKEDSAQQMLLGEWMKQQEELVENIDANIKRYKSLKRTGMKIDVSDFRVSMITVGDKCERAIKELEDALLLCKRARLLIEEGLAAMTSSTPS